MSDNQNKDQNQFIMETLKQNPLYKKKLLRRTLTTVLMAVLFGLIACLTFMLLQPLINATLNPEEKPQIVLFPEDKEEMAPEDMLVVGNDSDKVDTSEVGTLPMEEDEITDIVDGMIQDKDSYKKMYMALADYVKELEKSIVTVTAYTTNRDWFDNMQESKNQTSGLILTSNGQELLIVTDTSYALKAENLIVTFCDGTMATATLKQQDKYTGIAVLSVKLDAVEKDTIGKLQYAVLGSSNQKDMLGVPLIAMGSPMGVSNSIGYGVITTATTVFSVPDRNYKIIQTNIKGNSNSVNFLFSLDGMVMGVTTRKLSASSKDVISAYGISELRKLFEKLGNGIPMPYLGISGITVPLEANSSLGVPRGGFVSKVEVDSPAMLAGIQQGDIIVEFNGKAITNFTEYTSQLRVLAPGEDVKLVIKRKSQNDYKDMTFNLKTGKVTD